MALEGGRRTRQEQLVSHLGWLGAPGCHRHQCHHHHHGHHHHGNQDGFYPTLQCQAQCSQS